MDLWKSLYQGKILFQEYFSTQWPEFKEVKQLLVEVCSFSDAAVTEAMDSIMDISLIMIDQNSFACLFSFCSSNCDEQILDLMKANASMTCKSCQSKQPTCHFLTPNEEISLRCYSCRKSNLISKPPLFIYSVTAFERLESYMKYSDVILKQNIYASTSLGCASTVMFALESDFDNLLPFKFEDKDKRVRFENKLRAHISNIDGYHYRSKGMKKGSSRFICAQRDEGRTWKVQERKRRKLTKREYNCGGSINFNYAATRVVITIAHDVHHEPCPERKKLPESAFQQVTAFSNDGLLPFQILNNLSMRTTIPVSYRQVYHAWYSHMQSQYQFSKDSLESSTLFVKDATNMVPICRGENPFYLGFFTSIATKVLAKFDVKEAFIDSTYKTNKENLELFCLMGKIVGKGVPLAYLLLQAKQKSNAKQTEKAKKMAIKTFLQSFSSHFPEFKPRFFFTDKDWSQISAISDVFGVTASLCLWHVKRIMKSQFQEQKKGGAVFSEIFQTMILDLITDHFNQHPMICHEFKFLSAEEIRLKMWGEMEKLCNDNNAKDFKDYLLKNWYGSNRFFLWGRRNYNVGLPSSKTTMAVEGHWSVLKRRYLLLHNRPRVDFVLFIISKKMIPRLLMDIESILLGSLKPSWWNRFKLTWRKLEKTTLTGLYNTDTANWVCSCPAYLCNEFLLCKHVINGKTLPEYREINRLSRPPFLYFKVEKGRFFPNIMNEYNSYNHRKSFEAVETNQPAVIVPSPTLIATEVDNTKKEMLLLLQWATEHVETEFTSEDQAKQIKYLNEKILGPLNRYQHNVLQNRRANTLPTTWGCPDVIFLK